MGPVRKLFQENDFQIYYNNPEAANAKTRMGIIERFNGTMWGYIKKYTTSIGKLRFVDKVSDLFETTIILSTAALN